MPFFFSLKGAVDGGLRIPHNEKRFPGYDSEAKSFDPETLRKRIFGEHVADYMKMLSEEDQEAYNAHFSQYIKNGVAHDSIVEMYKKAHASIRADPSFTKKAPKEGVVSKRYNRKKFNLKQRKDRIRQILASATKKQQ